MYPNNEVMIDFWFVSDNATFDQLLNIPGVLRALLSTCPDTIMWLNQSITLKVFSVLFVWWTAQYFYSSYS